jgi:hypothetical protein
VTVTLTYATGRGHALIGRALYLPEGCAADGKHRELVGVPEQVMFATKPQLSLSRFPVARATAEPGPSRHDHRGPLGKNGPGRGKPSGRDKRLR